MTCISNVLIVGGGIAGLSAAIALSRIGIQCEVVELSGEALGASLGISGRAANALDELGVYDACYAEAAVYNAETSTALYRWDAAGELIMAAPPSMWNWPGAKAPIAMHRPVLLRILRETAESLGVKIHLGVTTETIEEQGDSTQVTLTNGASGTYDLLIGADGIGSATRKAFFPDAPAPTYVGQLSLRWMAPGPPVQPEGWYFGPKGRLGFYYLPQGVTYIPAVVDWPERVHLDDAAALALFTDLLDSYTAPAMVELRSRLTPDAKVIARPFEWLLVPGPWHRGRTLLIGDAAHATTAHLGMGGGMALEDAVVLAQCLSGAATLAEALEAFMVRRFERVKTVVEGSVALSRLEKEKAPPAQGLQFILAAAAKLSEPY